jgi:hypothetical protein
LLAFAPVKKKREAISGPMKDATPFHDWQNCRRADARAGAPMTTAYELAAVSSVARPQAMTNVQAQKPPNEAVAVLADEKCAVGQNRTAGASQLTSRRVGVGVEQARPPPLHYLPPSEYRPRPMRMVVL